VPRFARRDGAVPGPVRPQGDLAPARHGLRAGLARQTCEGAGSRARRGGRPGRTLGHAEAAAIRRPVGTARATSRAGHRDVDRRGRRVVASPLPLRGGPQARSRLGAPGRMEAPGRSAAPGAASVVGRR
jgi:hypothetical protein